MRFEVSKSKDELTGFCKRNGYFLFKITKIMFIYACTVAYEVRVQEK